MACYKSVGQLQRLCVKATAVVTALVAFTIVYFSLSFKCIQLTDGDTGRLLGAFPVKDGGEFSVSFIHSVNKTPVIDVYQVRGREIYVVRTVYYDFGAGVQSELQSGQTLQYGDDGAMIITGIDKRMDKLSYIVGTVSDHVLTYEGQSVSLRELCGKNTMVRFSIGRRILLTKG